MQDPDVVNVLHAHTISGLGIKSKIYDGEYLMCVTDLLNAHGVAITLGQVKFLPKALSHFIQSVHYNYKRPQAGQVVERQNHILASLTILTAFAYRCVDTEFAQQAVSQFL